jgi:hypothetical protein
VCLCVPSFAYSCGSIDVTARSDMQYCNVKGRRRVFHIFLFLFFSFSCIFSFICFLCIVNSSTVGLPVHSVLLCLKTTARLRVRVVTMVCFAPHQSIGMPVGK